MIFIIFLLTLQVEVFSHFWIIRKLQYDPTPDEIFLNLSKVFVIAFRILYPALIYFVMGERSFLALDLYVLTCLFLHLLLFPVELSLALSKPWHYLGKGTVDKILAFIPAHFRVWCLGVLAAGFWHAYFNQDLL